MNIRKKLAKVKHQDLGEIRGDSSSYESWLTTHARKTPEGLYAEDPQANPDELAEGTSYFGSSTPTAPQLLMGEAVQHLQGRQHQVYMLTMCEGYSLAEAATELGITKPTAQKFRDRAIKFVTQYCRNAMGQGRI